MPYKDPQKRKAYLKEYAAERHFLLSPSYRAKRIRQIERYREKVWAYTPYIDMLSESEKAWLAAVIDCEGTISLLWRGRQKVPNKGFNVHIQIGNTNLELLQKFYDLLGGEVRKYKGSKGLGSKPYWVSRIRGFGNILALLKAIYPSLIVKRERAKLVIEFLEYRKDAVMPKRYDDKVIDFLERIKILQQDERVGVQRLLY